jgi:uridine kinase
MKGDILIIDDNHRKAAQEVVSLIINDIIRKKGKYAMTVAGESGAGKSELSAAIAEILIKESLSTLIIAQDDYFILPPKTNARHREKDISWVGLQEVKLSLLDQNIDDILNDKANIIKPLVDFNRDSIVEETIYPKGFKVIIAEGTYTSVLKNVHCRIFIDRNKADTAESRKKRNREKQDDFLDRILQIEHEIISKHKILANIIISKEWIAHNQNLLKKPE